MAVSGAGVMRGGYDETMIKTDIRAMTVATALFFMVGFLTCLNDVLIPYLKSIFDLNYTEALLVQFAFFSSYFVFSYPAGRLVDAVGYKRTMVVGLLVMAVGALGFLPAARFALYSIFLGAYIVLAAGMTAVQVAVNPYVTIIGPAPTAASRLNLVQAFNSVGTSIAPPLGAYVILRGATPYTAEKLHTMSEVARQTYRATEATILRVPYIGIAVVLILLALTLTAVKLKTHGTAAETTQDFREGAYGEAAGDSVWNHGRLLAGTLGIFTYVGAEVAIGSLLVLYMELPGIAGFSPAKAGSFLTFYWSGAMVGRFLGSAALQRVRTGLLLGCAAIGALLLVVTSLLTHGHTAMYALLAVGFCNSIMFPSIFTLGIEGLGALTSKGSSLMIAAIVGGALIPLATGYLADRIGLQAAFVIPALCYVYIAGFGFTGRNKGTPGVAVPDAAVA